MTFKLISVDDNFIDNIIVKRIADKCSQVKDVMSFDSPLAFLDYMSNLKTTGVPAADLILLDINMPARDGWQVLEVLQDTYAVELRNSKIYLLSSSESMSDMNRAQVHPMVKDYIVKPLTLEKLNSIVMV
jgi:two-component system, chemotaxis family, chemotaxis protein CheY